MLIGLLNKASVRRPSLYDANPVKSLAEGPGKDPAILMFAAANEPTKYSAVFVAYFSRLLHFRIEGRSTSWTHYYLFAVLVY